jgi:hypothetical protein
MADNCERFNARVRARCLKDWRDDTRRLDLPMAIIEADAVRAEGRLTWANSEPEGLAEY